jgi:hypothetical protein
MKRIEANRGLYEPKPFHAAYEEGLVRTFGACHAPMPERMQDLIRQLGEQETAMHDRREYAMGDASALAEYYAAPLPGTRWR